MSAPTTTGPSVVAWPLDKRKSILPTVLQHPAWCRLVDRDRVHHVLDYDHATGAVEATHSHFLGKFPVVPDAGPLDVAFVRVAEYLDVEHHGAALDRGSRVELEIPNATGNGQDWTATQMTPEQAVALGEALVRAGRLAGGAR